MICVVEFSVGSRHRRGHLAERVEVPGPGTSENPLPKRGYQWLCQCGWRSNPTPDALAAHAQLEDHRMHEWYKARGDT
jgi:hypothetical protein